VSAQLFPRRPRQTSSAPSSSATTTTQPARSWCSTRTARLLWPSIRAASWPRMLTCRPDLRRRTSSASAASSQAKKDDVDTLLAQAEAAGATLTGLRTSALGGIAGRARSPPRLVRPRGSRRSADAHHGTSGVTAMASRQSESSAAVRFHIRYSREPHKLETADAVECV